VSSSTSGYDVHEAKPVTVSVSTAKRLSGLGATTLWGLIRDQKLEVVRIRRRTLITYRSLEGLLAPSSTSRQQRRRGGPPSER
jgi:hypothetical protein